MKPAENPPGRSEHPTLSSSLLAGAKRFDPESWSRLVNTFGPIVYGWCRSSGVQQADAADLVQDVFVSVAKGMPNFERQKEEGSFRSWLATITRSRVRDYLRRGANREAAVGGTDALQQMQDVAEELDSLDSTICSDGIGGTIHRRVLDSVRAEFEPKTWQAFWLTAVESKLASDVAQELDLSAASVYQAKSRVLRRLRQRLAELPE
ncbi:MAG: sigma-70 family RNA polymerase sigma factor [Pirellulaceae bacterium]